MINCTNNNTPSTHHTPLAIGENSIGDLNGDHYINLSDLSLLEAVFDEVDNFNINKLNELTGSNLTQEQALGILDFDGDGAITKEDHDALALYILQQNTAKVAIADAKSSMKSLAAGDKISKEDEKEEESDNKNDEASGTASTVSPGPEGLTGQAPLAETTSIV